MLRVVAARVRFGGASEARGCPFRNDGIRLWPFLRRADMEEVPELGDLAADRLDLPLAEVGTTAVQAPVVRDELGRGASELLEEVLAGTRPQIEHVRPDRARAGVAGRLDDVGQELRLVGEARQDRGHADAGLDAGRPKDRERPESLSWRRRVRLGETPDAL